MDKDLLNKYLALMNSGSDSDATLALRALRDLFQSSGASLEVALRYAAGNIDKLKQARDEVIEQKPAAASMAPATVNMSGVPECRVARPGVLEVILSGKDKGEQYPLPGETAQHAESIALHMKDAIVAAVINKCRFKLKLKDIKNNNGTVIETTLQAEYERAGMVPVQIWTHNNRGEVGALATVLRRLVSNSLPELAAA